MLAHALVAPNPHNRQPWITELSAPGRIPLVCDGTRLLPETDPLGRQILVGCGAFIELAVIAAAERGLAVTVEDFPGGAPGPTELPKGARVATLTLGTPGSAVADPLFAQIVRRHTNKTGYANDGLLSDAFTVALVDTARMVDLRAGVVAGAPAVSAGPRTPRGSLPDFDRLLKIGGGPSGLSVERQFRPEPAFGGC